MELSLNQSKNMGTMGAFHVSNSWTGMSLVLICTVLHLDMVNWRKDDYWLFWSWNFLQKYWDFGGIVCFPAQLIKLYFLFLFFPRAFSWVASSLWVGLLVSSCEDETPRTLPYPTLELWGWFVGSVNINVSYHWHYVSSLHFTSNMWGMLLHLENVHLPWIAFICLRPESWPGLACPVPLNWG